MLYYISPNSRIYFCTWIWEILAMWIQNSKFIATHKKWKWKFKFHNKKFWIPEYSSTHRYVGQSFDVKIIIKLIEVKSEWLIRVFNEVRKTSLMTVCNGLPECPDLMVCTWLIYLTYSSCLTNKRSLLKNKRSLLAALQI